MALHFVSAGARAPHSDETLGPTASSRTLPRFPVKTTAQPTRKWAVPTLALIRYFLFCRKWTQM